MTTGRELIEQLERDPWDQLPGEPNHWFDIFTRYRLFGASRTMRKFYRYYREQIGKEPTKQVTTPENWVKYSRLYNWQERAEAWDAYMHEAMEDEVVAILGEGIAMPHNRVAKLKLIGEKLEGYILDPKVTRVSPYVIEQYRGILDDIAKEKGERVKETRFTGTQGGPIVIRTEWGRGGSASDAWEQKKIPETIVTEAEKEIIDE